MECSISLFESFLYRLKAALLAEQKHRIQSVASGLFLTEEMKQFHLPSEVLLSPEPPPPSFGLTYQIPLLCPCRISLESL